MGKQYLGHDGPQNTTFTVLVWSVTRLCQGSYVFMHESFEAATMDSKTRYARKLATTFDLSELRI
jgi:hypothetical protein